MKHPFGLVIGKFYPPHRGHRLLIEHALSCSDEVVVIVCGKPSDSIPGPLRGKWIQEIHPTAKVMVIDDRYDENDSQVWAENTVRWLGRAPDAVFTSEDYGDRYAAIMGCRHICVDKARKGMPISGTAVRHDPYANWDFIEPPVRGWFAKRICVLGAESTGTTTLAKALAEHLETPWVEEYGREYSEKKLLQSDQEWKTEEFTEIALEQARRENAAACRSNRLLICDTNGFATMLWHRRYTGKESEKVRKIADQGKCDLYLLTGDEIPFVHDGLRDGEHIRHAMHGWFEEELSSQRTTWRTMRGSHKERMNEAIHLIVDLFKDSAWKPGC